MTQEIISINKTLHHQIKALDKVYFNTVKENIFNLIKIESLEEKVLEYKESLDSSKIEIEKLKNELIEKSRMIEMLKCSQSAKCEPKPR